MIKRISIGALLIFASLVNPSRLVAQGIQEYKDSVVFTSPQVSFKADLRNGKVSYRCGNGARLNNTVAYLDDIRLGGFTSSDFAHHEYQIGQVRDSLGVALRLTFKHYDDQHPLLLEQQITLYPVNGSVLILLRALKKDTETQPLESRNISPVSVLPEQGGSFAVTGSAPRLLDAPFDNDDWINMLEQSWPPKSGKTLSGKSYEYSSLYDYHNMSGLVIGSVKHDFWKTGIAYRMTGMPGTGDSLIVYGGIATSDNLKVERSHEGRDGTHDHALHGTMKGDIIVSPLIYLAGSSDIRNDFKDYGLLNAKISGKLSWKGYAPVYWNSYGVEGVLGHEGIMMPPAVGKISDFIHSMDNFNAYAKPVMSVDSYDQDIYTTELLTSLGRYAEHQRQQMGFYFIPFAAWTWKNAINDQELHGTHYPLKDVVLRDKNGEPILYKDGDFCAYALDPTHPAIKEYVTGQLQKAKTINAKFIKIDFLTAGALESTVRYDPACRTGMQAYNKGMKMLKHLADSIMGPDIFITMAISPMFPSQYAHTRFISTDVYSHLRDDQKGFPPYGSTEASLSTGSHLWWVQGTLWPFTNLDVTIMKNFQKNPDLSENEIKVRIYAMMSMGSILGDGSDFRNPIAASRASTFLNNKNVCAFFSQPKAFTPIRFSDGETLNQQLSFSLPGESVLLSMFNFDLEKPFNESFSPKELGMTAQNYVVKDFITDAVLSHIQAGDTSFSLSVKSKDALMVKIVPEK